MVKFEYLYKGLCGLANAHRASAMAGHLGAALVAGYFFGEDQGGLDDAVYRGVERELDRIVKGEEGFWFNPQKAGITIAELFEPMPQQAPDAARVDGIAEALANNIGATRQSGHNVIFAALAIRAIKDHPEFATPAIVDGIRRLIAGFDNAGPGRGYYGKTTGWKAGSTVDVSEIEGPAPYADQAAMIAIVMDELCKTAAVRKQGFGGLWHIINHAAGLIELSRYGYGELSRQGLAAHRHHVRLWRTLPDVSDELGTVQAADHDPRTAAYWMESLKRDEARLTHRIKTLYGFFTLWPAVEEQREETLQALAYLMD